MKARNRGSLIIAISLTALVISTLACSPFGGKTTVLPTTAPNTQISPTNTAPPPAGQATSKSPGSNPAAPTHAPAQQNNPPNNQQNNTSTTIRMINDSGDTVCYVYLSGTWESDWGTDWLGSDVVYDGDEYNFTVNAGNWDMMATDCDGNILEEAYNIGVPTTGLRWTVDSPTIVDTNGSLTISNDSDTAACYVYIGPAGSEYSDDLLGSATIPAYTDYTIYDIPNGEYCILVEACDNSIMYDSCGFNVYSGSTVYVNYEAPPSVEYGDITIDNQTGFDACYIYISPSTSSSWGDDWLGSDILYAGNSYWFDVGYADSFDIKMEDCSNTSIYEIYDYWIGSGAYLTAW